MGSLADELAELKGQFEAMRAKISDLEQRVAGEGEGDAETKTTSSVVENPLSDIDGDTMDAAPVAIAAPAAAAAALPMPTSRDELWQVIKSASAKRTESPLNLHQATVFYCLVKKDALPWQKALFLGLSFIIIVLQAWVPAALFAEMMEGNYQGLHCSVNSDCYKFGSSFCHPAEVPLGHYHQCNKCVDAYELDEELGVLNYTYKMQIIGEPRATTANMGEYGKYHWTLFQLPYANLTDLNDPDFACPESDPVCQACWDPVSRRFPHDYVGRNEQLHHDFEEETGQNLIETHCISLVSGWVAFILSCIVVGTSVVSEIRDIKLCEMQVRDATDVGKRWLACFELMQTIRQWGFLPWMCLLVPMVLEFQGGDPMSICLNTVVSPTESRHATDSESRHFCALWYLRRLCLQVYCLCLLTGCFVLAASRQPVL